MLRILFAISLLLPTAALAQGALRTIPGDATPATLRHISDSVVEVDGVRRQLAPGAQIRDTQNRVVLPMSLAQPRLVRLIADPDARIRQVWVLTPQEALQAR